LLAGLLVANLSADACYLIVAAGLLSAAAVSVGIRTDFQPAEQQSGIGGRRLAEPLAGFPALLGRPKIRSVFGAFMAQTATRGLLNVMIVSVAVTLLGEQVSSTGVLLAALGAGGLVGAMLTLVGTTWRPARPFAIGMCLWGLPLLAIAAWPSAVMAWCAIAVIGAGNGVADVSGFTLFHRLVPDHLLGRAFGAFWGSAAATQALGAALAAPLISWSGIRGAIVVGAAMTAVALACWVSHPAPLQLVRTADVGRAGAARPRCRAARRARGHDGHRVGSPG